MILRTEVVRQLVNGTHAVELTKDVILTPGAQPLGMVRKRLAGDRPTRGTVILVHGFAHNRYTWHSSKRSFSAYLDEQGWDVFNVDLRGHGRSRRFGADKPGLLDEYIFEDVPACVREAIRLSGHERVFLVGHSMGGLIAYAAAATALRDQLAGLITIGSPYRFGAGNPVLRAGSMAFRAIRSTGVLDSNPRFPLRALGLHLHSSRRLWNSKLFPFPVKVWAEGTIEDEILEEYLRKSFDWTSMAIAFDVARVGLQRALTSRDGRDYGTAFEWLNRPLLVISGSKDTLAPPDSVRPAYERSRAQDKSYRCFPQGHVDLIMGHRAPLTVWPTIQTWLSRRAYRAEVPVATAGE